MAIVVHLPKDLTRWIVPRAWLRVRTSTRPRLETTNTSVPIEVHKVLSTSDARRMAKDLKPTSTNAVTLVAGRFLPSRLTDALESRGIGYLDAAGRLHLPWSDGVIHIDTTKLRVTVNAEKVALGVHAVRAVQAILAAPSDIKISALAASTALSVSRVHQVLVLLAEQGLVRTRGRGPATTRDVIDRAALLDWLATQHAARRRDRALEANLYARRPDEGWRRMSLALDEAGVAHALTGSAAAMALGAGPTNLLTSTVRVDPDTPLEAAARLIGAEPTDRGANVRLIHDVGRVGSQATTVHDRVRVAPPVRVYLDLLEERRGADLAAHFREVVLGY